MNFTRPTTELKAGVHLFDFHPLPVTPGDEIKPREMKYAWTLP